MPAGVARIVDGTRKLFEVCCSQQAGLNAFQLCSCCIESSRHRACSAQWQQPACITVFQSQSGTAALPVGHCTHRAVHPLPLKALRACTVSVRLTSHRTWTLLARLQSMSAQRHIQLRRLAASGTR